MNANDIIVHLEQLGSWVNWDKTRDIVVYGEANKNITQVGVCWVATIPAIKQAIEQNIQFIISHENPFYHMATNLPSVVRASVEEKKKLLEDNTISVYRCHDVWDNMPNVGVADSWAKRLGFECVREFGSYIQHATIAPTTVSALAKHIAHVLHQDGENGVYVFGDTQKIVRNVGLGTGAATDIFAMLKKPCDVVIVADDGINNYYQGQYVIDQGISMIVVNHAGCEIAGLKSMADYLQIQFPQLSCSYLFEGYDIKYYVDGG